jgi:hypothetical protein
MVEGVSRVPVFRLPPKRYTSAAALSVVVHAALALGAFGWARQSLPLEPFRVPMERPQPHPLHYVVLLPPPPLTAVNQPDSIAPLTRPGRSAPIPRRRRQQTGARASQREEPLSTGSLSGPPTPDPLPPVSRFAVYTHAIGPGEITSVAGAGNTLIDYARADQRDQIRIGEIEPVGPDGKAGVGNGDGPGTTRVAELLGAAGTACPALRRALSNRRGELTVAVGFDVDADGAVDPTTLHVVRSPAQPQIEHRFYSHIYAVAGSASLDAAMPEIEAAYDSALTRDVLRHVAVLQFRPALRDGHPVRSTVLVSCQSP